MTFRDETFGDIISYLGTYTREQSTTKIISKSLDGAVYMQTIGLPSEEIRATIIYPPDMEQILKRADSQSSLISLTTKDEVIYGRIVSLELGHKWINGMYSAEVLLLKEE